MAWADPPTGGTFLQNATAANARDLISYSEGRAFRFPGGGESTGHARAHVPAAGQDARALAQGRPGKGNTTTFNSGEGEIALRNIMRAHAADIAALKPGETIGSRQLGSFRSSSPIQGFNSENGGAARPVSFSEVTWSIGRAANGRLQLIHFSPNTNATPAAGAPAVAGPASGPQAPNAAPAEPTPAGGGGSRAAVVEPATAAARPGACNARAAPVQPSGAPGLAAKVGNASLGLPIAVLASGAGGVVAKETGSPLAGTATSLGIGTGGAVVIAKATGQGVLRTAGGGLVVGAAGGVTRAGIRAAGGSETQGDVGGYAAAGLAGAAFGGPVGAGAAVVTMAAADGVSAGVDWYYANREGQSLEERRQLLIVHSAFAAIHNRNISTQPLANIDYFKRVVAQPGGADRLREMLAPGAHDLINQVHQAHLGRPATAAEMQAWQDQLARGEWIGELERGMMTDIQAGRRRR